MPTIPRTPVVALVSPDSVIIDVPLCVNALYLGGTSWRTGGKWIRCRTLAFRRLHAVLRITGTQPRIVRKTPFPIQQDQVREWAREHGVEIIQEFADHGRSGLTAEGRPAFTDMMENWVKVRHDFQYILCLDVSRRGRFQDIDLSAQFSAECKRANKQVIYTTIGKPREDDPLYGNSALKTRSSNGAGWQPFSGSR